MVKGSDLDIQVLNTVACYTFSISVDVVEDIVITNGDTMSPSVVESAKITYFCLTSQLRLRICPASAGDVM
jgi:hypothetical protein